MKSTLKNKVVVITGGAGLLGKVLVEAVVENEGMVIIAEKDYEKSKEIAGILTQKYSQKLTEAISLDITSRSSLQETISALDKKYGRIDALVNSAYPRNSNYGRRFEDVTYEDLCENVNLHLGGYFLASQQYAEYFKRHGGGTIINIASIYGVIAPRFEIYNNTPMTMPVEYATIKSAIIHLTKYLAKYYKGTNVRINAISPGGIYGNQPDSFVSSYNRLCLSKGLLDPADICGALLFLLSDMSEFVNGQNIVVDDGFAL